MQQAYAVMRHRPGDRNGRDVVRAGAAHDVGDRDDERRVDRLDLDRLDRDQVAELPLQRALHEVLRGGRDLGPARLEDQRQQAAAEVRAASPARRAR